MKYDQFSYLTPPRADKCIPRSLVAVFQRKGWIAQVKKNGTNSVIFVPPDRKPIAYNRHGQRHRVWNFSSESAALFAAVPGNEWWVFNAELLHSKVSGGPRDTNYVHDVLVAAGQYLVGETYQNRYSFMVETLLDAHRRLIGKVSDLKPVHGSVQLTPKTWIADVVQPSLDYASIYDNLSDPADEGLVLKDPRAALGTQDGRGANWMVKIRRTTKNFSF